LRPTTSVWSADVEFINSKSKSKSNEKEKEKEEEEEKEEEGLKMGR
jgi:hypothetical protein